MGGQVMPTGDALLSGYYLNELLLRLLARDDPHPALFDAYAAAVQVLPATMPAHGEALRAGAARLRAAAAARDRPAAGARRRRPSTLAPLAAAARAIALVPEGGLRGGRATTNRAGLAARNGWRCSARSTTRRAASPRRCAALRAGGNASSSPSCAHLLHYHCGVATLRTRQLMLDLQAL